jgi:hypothetical protein
MHQSKIVNPVAGWIVTAANYLVKRIENSDALEIGSIVHQMHNKFILWTFFKIFF